VAVGWWWFGEFSDELFDPDAETVDLVAAGVDLVQQQPGQISMMVIETTVERFEKPGPFGVELASGHAGEDLRVTFTSDERFDHRSR
jgi:hypothetical protein